MRSNDFCSRCLDTGRVEERCIRCNGTGYFVEDGRYKHCDALECDEGMVWIDCPEDVHWL